jgi:hypothetical protein
LAGRRAAGFHANRIERERARRVQVATGHLA